MYKTINDLQQHEDILDLFNLLKCEKILRPSNDGQYYISFIGKRFCFSKENKTNIFKIINDLNWKTVKYRFEITYFEDYDFESDREYFPCIYFKITEKIF